MTQNELMFVRDALLNKCNDLLQDIVEKVNFYEEAKNKEAEEAKKKTEQKTKKGEKSE